MTTILTTAGELLFADLEAGNVPDPDFGVLLFGRGNDTPADGDTVDDVSQLLLTSSSSQPLKGDTDVRNQGRGAGIWTWAFEVPPQPQPWVASNVAMAPIGATGTDELAVHALTTVWSEPYRSLIVWVNVSETEAVISSAYQEDAVEAARLRSVGARADILFGGFGSQVLKIGEVYSQVRAGESVTLRGQIYSDSGLRLTVDQVRHVTQTLWEVSDDGETFVQVFKRHMSDCMVERTTNEASALFPYRGGFNFYGSLPGRYTRNGRDKRVVYELLLTDGNTRVLRQNVRVHG